MSLQFSGDSLTIQGANIKEQKEYLFQRGHTECNDKKKKDKDGEKQQGPTDQNFVLKTRSE